MKEEIILGIDPGTQVMGYGIIKVSGQNMSLVQFGVLHLRKYPDHYARLGKIFERVSQIVREFKVTQVALESPFYGKNIQAMLKLGRAQGVAMAAALACNIPVSEYAPKRVKQAVTGQGSASKEQVAKMLQNILNFKEMPDLLDATDAVSVAVCHYYQSKSPLGNVSGGGGWKAFLSQNPDRVVGKKK
ncbi:MAG: crossover junction endodeoxyribonuclease RuvC [Bacteroidota bacterium]